MVYRGVRSDVSGALTPITLLAWLLGTFQPLELVGGLVLSDLALARHHSNSSFSKPGPIAGLWSFPRTGVVGECSAIPHGFMTTTTFKAALPLLGVQ